MLSTYLYSSENSCNSERSRVNFFSDAQNTKNCLLNMRLRANPWNESVITYSEFLIRVSQCLGPFRILEEKEECTKTQGVQQKECKGEACCDVCITGITPGKIVDYGVRDSMNMGAAMAPAAAACIAAHLEDFSRSPSYYDKIITGDLGAVGRDILIELLQQKNIDIGSCHTDCGLEIFDNERQGTGSGGSGCGCAAVTMSAHFLPMMRRGELKRVLFVPTGALLSKISFNEGENVPGIAHAVVLEVLENR